MNEHQEHKDINKLLLLALRKAEQRVFPNYTSILEEVPDRMRNREVNQDSIYMNNFFNEIAKKALEGFGDDEKEKILNYKFITVDDEPKIQARIQEPIQEPMPMPMQVPMPGQHQQMQQDRKSNYQEKPENNGHITQYHKKEPQESSQQDNKSNQDSRVINFDSRQFEQFNPRNTRAIRIPDNLQAFEQQLQSNFNTNGQQIQGLSIGRLREFVYESLKYPISTEPTQLCELCSVKEYPAKFGSLLLVPSFRIKGKTYPIHEMCALWSQNLVFHTDDGQIDPKNIDDEIDRAQSTSCRQCYRNGASVTCGECDESYHFQCIMNTDLGIIIPDSFMVRCEQHKINKPPRQQQQILNHVIELQIEESPKLRKLTRIEDNSLDVIKLEQ